MMKRVKQNPFSDRLTLWGVDRPSANPEMLLNFVEKMAQNQLVPPLARTWEELESRRSSLQLRVRHSLGLDPWPERTPFKSVIVG
jgi:hypothetical protein